MRDEVKKNLIGCALIPIVASIIFLWLSLVGVQEDVMDVRGELAEFKTELVGALSENTRAINHLSDMINTFLDEKSE